MNPLISVIVPIYKVEPYLRQCLDSIVNQTYTNLEIILVDDGSPDGCPAICDEYAAKDKRIVVIHKENGGLSDARNAGLDICKGEYISFVDSDDWIKSFYIETFVQILLHEGDYDFIAANFSIQKNDTLIRGVFQKDFILNNTSDILIKYCLLGNIPICAWNKLYNINFLRKNLLTFKKNLLFEDQLWCLQCSEKAKKIRVIPQELYIYNTRNDSIMNSSDISLDKRIESWGIILSETKNILNSKKIPKQIANTFFLHKIEEALSTSLSNFQRFHKSYQKIQKHILNKPILYWYLTASPIKKILFALLHITPSIISQFLLYKHLKQHIT